MSKAIKQVAYAIAGSSLTLAIWGIGWILYDKLQLWEYIKNLDYQNLLLAAIGVQMTMWMLAVARIKRELTELDKKALNKIFSRATKKLTPKIEEHDSKLTELNETIADLKLALKMAPDTPREATK
jgi:hypothetical protein